MDKWRVELGLKLIRHCLVSWTDSWTLKTVRQYSVYNLFSPSEKLNSASMISPCSVYLPILFCQSHWSSCLFIQPSADSNKHFLQTRTSLQEHTSVTKLKASSLSHLSPGDHPREISKASGCAGVFSHVWGGPPPISSHAGYLLLVMVTLLAHGRRGVMMEDGAR